MTSEDRGSSVNKQMKKNQLHRFFIYELQDIHQAEKQLIEALPEMIEAAGSGELISAIDHHLAQTKEHTTRLEKIFQMLDEKSEEKQCKAMTGILKEGKEMLGETEEGTAVRDAAIIVAAQKIEHYEIVTYGSLLAFSELMKHNEVSRLLKETLDEEEQTNASLTDLAESGINEKAMKAG